MGQTVSLGSSSPKNIEEEADGVNVDDDQEGDDVEEDEIMIEILETLSEDVKGKIRKYHEEIFAKQLEIVTFQEVRNELADRLKKTHKYLGLLKKQKKSFQSVRRKSGEGQNKKCLRC